MNLATVIVGLILLAAVIIDLVIIFKKNKNGCGTCNCANNCDCCQKNKKK